MKLKPQRRFLQSEARDVDAESRTIALSFSSETPVERYFGNEILLHDRGAADLSRLNNKAPLLFNHDMNDVIGVVESARIGDDRRGYATVRFAKTNRGDEVLGMVRDGILPNVSFMYRILDAEEEKGDFRVTRWEPLEISVVTIPADQTIGIGRSFTDEENEVFLHVRSQPETAGRDIPAVTAAHTGVIHMTEQTNAAVTAPAEPQPVQLSAEQIERQRIESIRKFVKANGLQSAVERSWIERGLDWDKITDEFLALKNAQAETTPQTPTFLDMERKEAQRYSLLRAIRASINKDWSKAGLELEANRAISKRMNRIPRSETSWFVPLDVMMRDMTAAGTSGSNYLISVNNQPGSFIELLRNTSVALRMGATRLSGLVGNVTIPKMTASGTAYWLTDETTQVTESQPTIGQLPLAPKNVAALTEISHQLMQQSSPDAEQLVLSSIAKDIGLAVDVGVIRGSGASGQPQGIVGTSGIGSVSGTSLAAAGIIEFQTDVATNNALMPGCGYVTTPAVAGLLMARPELPTTGTTRMWTGNLLEGSMLGFPAMASAQMSTATMLFGHWPSVIVAEWGVLEMMTNPFSDFTRGLTAVRGWYTCDVGVRYPAAFSYASSIT